jgi:hypothetical protein
VNFVQSKTSEASKTGEFYNHSTQWDDRGEGNVWFLDRHFLNCDYRVGAVKFESFNHPYSNGSLTHKFLTGFHLDRSGDRIRYQYDCSDFSFNGATSSHSSYQMGITTNVRFDNNPNFPRHSAHRLTAQVMCPYGQGLISFGLVRIPQAAQSKHIDAAQFINMVAESMDYKYSIRVAANNLLRLFGVTETPADGFKYVFRCAPIPNLRNCFGQSTPWSIISYGYTEYLDRQNIKLGPNQAMQGFQMISSASQFGHGHIHYQYTVCYLN